MSKWFRDMLFDQGILSLTRVILFFTFALGMILTIVAAIAAFIFCREWSQAVSIISILLGTAIGGKILNGGIASVYDSERGRPPMKMPIYQQNYPAKTDVESKPNNIKEGNQ